MAESVSYNDWFEVANNIQQEADATGVGRPKPVPTSSSGHTILERFDKVVTSEALRSASRGLFSDGHYARAVEEAFKCLNNAVKSKSGLAESDGEGLMMSAFSEKGPALRFNNLKTKSEKNEQRGYMYLYAGAIAGIRNPRAHEHELYDNPKIALELLVLANHLMDKLETTRKTRRRKKRS